jgi:hypothetical protein
MLLFATSDKGGTGRSVTSCNLAFRRALQGSDVCYLDFDFGSPTAGAVLEIPSVEQGTTEGGTHSYLRGTVAEPHRVDVWSESERSSLRARPPGAGRLVLFPGDVGGSEFSNTSDLNERCVQLLLRAEEEFELCIVDLSAGRSYATDMVLAATAAPELRSVVARWLVFHRWTRQHVAAAADLVFGKHGIIAAGAARGHDPRALTNAIRFVRTVVMDPNSSDQAGLRASQQVWLRDCNDDLQQLASKCGVGRTVLLGSIPLDPVLQWHEQLITDNDVIERQIANQQTLDAFITLAKKLTDDAAWMGL